MTYHFSLNYLGITNRCVSFTARRGIIRPNGRCYILTFNSCLIELWRGIEGARWCQLAGRKHLAFWWTKCCNFTRMLPKTNQLSFVIRNSKPFRLGKRWVHSIDSAINDADDTLPDAEATCNSCKCLETFDRGPIRAGKLFNCWCCGKKSCQ